MCTFGLMAPKCTAFAFWFLLKVDLSVQVLNYITNYQSNNYLREKNGK